MNSTPQTLKPDWNPADTHLAPWNPRLQIAWDATSLRSLMTCPRKYEYEILQGRKNGNEAMRFGLVYHAAKEILDAGLAEAVEDQELHGTDYENAYVNAALTEAIHYAWTETEKWGTEDDIPCADNARTRYTLIRGLVWSLEALGTDILTPFEFPDGTLGIELSWRVPLPLEYIDYDKLAALIKLGVRKSGEQYSAYLLCGHFDGLVNFQGDVYVLERKTTKQTLKSFFFKNYSPDVQISTYALAADLIYQTLDVRGVIVEALQTAVSFSRFLRQPIKRTPEQRSEFLEEVIYYIKKAEEYAESGVYPKNEAVCGLYGGCAYRKICSLSPSVRQDFLESGFKLDKWNPLIVR